MLLLLTILMCGASTGFDSGSGGLFVSSLSVFGGGANRLGILDFFLTNAIGAETSLEGICALIPNVAFSAYTTLWIEDNLFFSLEVAWSPNPGVLLNFSRSLGTNLGFCSGTTKGLLIGRSLSSSDFFFHLACGFSTQIGCLANSHLNEDDELESMLSFLEVHLFSTFFLVVVLVLIKSSFIYIIFHDSSILLS